MMTIFAKSKYPIKEKLLILGNFILKFRVNLLNLKSHQLVERIYQAIKEFESDINQNKDFETKNIVAFKTK